MSIVLNLEVSEDITVESLVKVLKSIEGCEIDWENGKVSAYFSRSNASVVIDDKLDDKCVITDNMEGHDWSVGVRVYFDVDVTRPNALCDIRRYVVELSRITKFPFVLSFQYEKVYSINGSNGLVFKREF